jgi:hypothetical protein
MTRYYVFNGDADGLCALQQLRLVEPGDATLVTGVKRDIGLLERVNAAGADAITVLDISLDRNRRLGCCALFRPSYAGEVPEHPHFEPHIEEISGSVPHTGRSPSTDASRGDRSAFGDGLPRVGAAMASAIDSIIHGGDIGEQSISTIMPGRTSPISHSPRRTANQMVPFEDPPISFGSRRRSHGWPQATGWCAGKCTAACAAGARATIVVLQDEPWARRVIGVLANELARLPRQRHCRTLAKARGGFVVGCARRRPARSARRVLSRLRDRRRQEQPPASTIFWMEGRCLWGAPRALQAPAQSCAAGADAFTEHSASE